VLRNEASESQDHQEVEAKQRVFVQTAARTLRCCSKKVGLRPYHVTCFRHNDEALRYRRTAWLVVSSGSQHDGDSAVVL
jgi:hypothetical protein